MTARLLPEVGHWYAHRDKGLMFQVVAVDADAGVVEIQDFDGDVDEIEIDGWFSMPLDPAEPPEDGRGSVDDDEADEYRAGADSDHPARDWRGPLDELPAQPQEAVEADEFDEERPGR